MLQYGGTLVVFMPRSWRTANATCNVTSGVNAASTLLPRHASLRALCPTSSFINNSINKIAAANYRFAGRCDTPTRLTRLSWHSLLGLKFFPFMCVAIILSIYYLCNCFCYTSWDIVEINARYLARILFWGKILGKINAVTPMSRWNIWIIGTDSICRKSSR